MTCSTEPQCGLARPFLYPSNNCSNREDGAQGSEGVSDSTYLEADEERLIPNIRNRCDIIPKVDKAVLDHGWRPGAQWTTMHLIKVYNSRDTKVRNT